MVIESVVRVFLALRGALVVDPIRVGVKGSRVLRAVGVTAQACTNISRPAVGFTGGASVDVHTGAAGVAGASCDERELSV